MTFYVLDEAVPPASPGDCRNKYRDLSLTEHWLVKHSALGHGDHEAIQVEWDDQWQSIWMQGNVTGFGQH